MAREGGFAGPAPRVEGGVALGARYLAPSVVGRVGRVVEVRVRNVSTPADAWTGGMRVANERILGAALLLDPLSTMYNLQIERVVRCAGSPIRRLVTGLGEMQA